MRITDEIFFLCGVCGVFKAKSHETSIEARCAGDFVVSISQFSRDFGRNEMCGRLCGVHKPILARLWKKRDVRESSSYGHHSLMDTTKSHLK